ncbi:MAG: alcohol dehydrogenase catalytic domain-containing protein [Armatimonadetes bacterium]|nr:alcohol dehydrogenase catalytic domain-containing protein [Armatimonadota bacterium]
MEVLVKITAAGICGSDVAAWREIERDWHRRGHEFAGVVEAVGEGVTGIAIGQAVAGYGSLPCRVCAHCRRGKLRFCLSPKGSGGGAFAEYICAPAEFWFPIDGLSCEEGALLEPLTVALEMVRDADVKLGDHVVLLGAGPIGLMALAICKAIGAKVYVVHPRTSRRRWETAEAWGADAMIDAHAHDVAGQVRAYTTNGADAVLVTTRPSDTLDLAAQCATRGGTLSLVGMEWRRAQIALDIDRFHFANLRLVGSNHNPCSLYYEEAAELLRRKIVRADELISHRFALREIEQAFITASEHRADVAKVMIVG